MVCEHIAPAQIPPALVLLVALVAVTFIALCVIDGELWTRQENRRTRMWTLCRDADEDHLTMTRLDDPCPACGGDGGRHYDWQDLRPCPGCRGLG